jgi:hypothetical protein
MVLFGTTGRRRAYQLVNIPAPVLATPLRLSDALMDAEVPVQMSGLPAPALLVGLEAPTTLRAGLTKSIVQERDELRSKSKENE